MQSSSSRKMIVTALAVTALTTLAGLAQAQSAPAAHEIPQSQRSEHMENLQRLQGMAARPGKVGEIAKRAVALFKEHDARESDYIMPPLTLLPVLADGKVTPDMQWAVDMSDRVKADREVIFQEHTRMIDVLNQLRAAGEQAHDAEAVDFAQGAAIDALNDVEILEPTAVMIGDYIRAKLAAAH
jgi:hypothetical protein